MKLSELRQQQADFHSECDRIITAAEKEKRRMTDVERDRIAVLDKELKSLDDEIVLQENFLERRRNAESEPDANGSIVDVAERNAQLKAGKPLFKNLSDQLSSVIKAGRFSHQAVDPRLGMVAVASGLGESVPSDGGFLVERQFDSEILTKTYDIGEILKRVRKIAIGAGYNGLRMNAVDETSRVDGSRWGGVLAYWASEGDALTASKPKFRQIEMVLQKLTGLVYLTDELIMDTTALQGVVMEALPEELNFRTEDAIFEGSGAGQPQGLLNSSALVVVPKDSGQAAATITWSNIQNMWARLWARSYPNSVWLVNQDCLPQLQQMTNRLPGDTAGTPVWLPAGAAIFGAGTASPNGTLMGRPLIPIEYANTLGTEGDITLLDLSQYLMIDKSTIESASSIHVRFLNDEMVLRFIYRANGQPTWNKPLTPFKGSNTKSPFVTLATRS